jgi:hypothetical protein
VFRSTFGSVVFHSPGELQVSAAVHGAWNRPLLELLVESGAAGGFGNDVHDSCAQFIGWCAAEQPRPGSFSVHSLPGVPWADEDYDRWVWYDRVLAEFEKWDPPPYLVDLEAFDITHRGEVVWPPPERRRPKRTDRRSRPPGEPFPCGWSGQDIGDRPGEGTYECYPPDELPPLRVPLTGTFDWLRAAPEYERSIAGNPAETAAALGRLLTADAEALPRPFVEFFRAPALWRRVRSCTDCYLDLDSTAVEIPGGLGRLVRFLADSQGCLYWNLHLRPDGAEPTVVTTYHFSGSENMDRRAGRPHPRDITTCAPSFEAFLYRFWLENELWFALNDGQPLPEHGQQYLAFYRASGAAES